MPGSLDDRIVDIVEALEREGCLPLRYKGKFNQKTEIRFGSHGSLSIEIAGPKKGSWKDFDSGKGGGPWQLISQYVSDVGQWLEHHRFTHHKVEQSTSSRARARAEGNPQNQRSNNSSLGPILATYDYTDEQGRLLFQVVRYANHQFRQRRPDGHGSWSWGRGNTKPVLYHLPELIAARATGNGHPPRVYLCEGEKDADRLRKDWGVCATTNPGGAGNWEASFNQYFVGFEVILLEDNDPAGQERSARLGQALTKAGASVKIIPPLGTDEHSDISDWLDDGLSQSIFEDLLDDIEPVEVANQTVVEDEHEEDVFDVKHTRESVQYRGRIYHREVDGRRLSPDGWLLRQTGPNSWEAVEPPEEEDDAVELFAPTTLEGKTAPPQDWLVDNWIPIGRVTALYGEGGGGKTTIIQMLATACALGVEWYPDFPTLKCHSILHFCEDDIPEMWRRQEAINRYYGCSHKDLGLMHWLPRLGKNNALMTFDFNKPIETRFFRNIYEAVTKLNAELYIADVLADVFIGNENDRMQVHQFGRLFGKLAKTGCAVVPLAHPSISGELSGRSGSTGWYGLWRSHMHLELPGETDPEDGTKKRAQTDDGLRTLTRKKATYARRDETLDLKWDDGVYRPLGPPSGGIIASIVKRTCKRVARDLFEKLWGEGQELSNRNGTYYAPKLFSRRPQREREGFTRKDFEIAIQGLLSEQVIKVEACTRSKHEWSKYVAGPNFSQPSRD